MYPILHKVHHPLTGEITDMAVHNTNTVTPVRGIASENAGVMSTCPAVSFQPQGHTHASTHKDWHAQIHFDNKQSKAHTFKVYLYVWSQIWSVHSHKNAQTHTQRTCLCESIEFLLLIRVGRINSTVDSLLIECSLTSAALCLPNDQVDLHVCIFVHMNLWWLCEWFPASTAPPSDHFFLFWRFRKQRCPNHFHIQRFCKRGLLYFFALFCF